MLKDVNGSGGADGEPAVAFVDATMGIGDRSTAALRGEIGQIMGDAALIHIAAVIATFEATNRISDSIGTRLDDYKESTIVNLHRAIGF